MNHERQPSEEVKKGAEFDISKEVKENLKKLEQERTNSEHETDESAVETIRETIETEATSAEKIKQKQKPTEATDDSYSVHTHAKLKLDAYKKLLTDIQVKLSPRQKSFSSFVHKPIVETISEAASKTVARPVGIAWGSIITFLGTVISLFYAYRYGIPFNYLLFILFFVGGYLLATALELGYKLFARNVNR